MNILRWDGNGARPKDGIYIPASYGFVLPHPCPNPYDRGNFLTPSPPFAAPQSLTSPLPIKLNFFVNLPYN